MADDTVLMGDYEISCTPDRALWRLWDRLECREDLFETLHELTRHIARTIDRIDIEEEVSA